jgi:hypothetical protein
MNTISIAVSAFVLASLVLPTAAQQPTKIDFSSETVGAEAKSLVRSSASGASKAKPERTSWPSMAVNGRKASPPRGLPTKRERFTASAMRNFSIGSKLMRTTLMLSRRTSKISAAARSPFGSRAYPDASTRAPAYCSI